MSQCLSGVRRSSTPPTMLLQYFTGFGEGHNKHKEDNVFDRAFRANNAKTERTIGEDTRCDVKLVAMADTDTETFDIAQLVHSDIRPGGFHESPSCFFCNYPSSATLHSYGLFQVSSHQIPPMISKVLRIQLLLIYIRARRWEHRALKTH
jgi:hypothetical protein